MDKLIDFALRQRLLVVVAAAVIFGAGAWAYTRLPVDAYPDISPALVQVFTETEGLAPEEVEQLVTYPVEVAMNGLPGLDRIRSVSNFGLSVVNVYFDEGTDIYFARQLVNERLQEAREQIPEGLGDPQMGPISSGLGQILFYYLDDESGSYTLEELRTIQDWIVKRNLQTVRGVTEVLSIGGHVRQYHVVVDPASLRQYDLSLHDVLEAVEANNLNVGASFLEVAREEYIVRSVGLAETLDDLRDITIVTRGGTPVRVTDVARVDIGPEIRRGLVTRNGEGEVVVGFVLKLLGTNTSTVIDRVEDRLDQIRTALPEGVRLVPYYEQSGLVDRATRTVTTALWQGLILVVVVLAVFLGNLRSSLIVALSLPFSILLTFLLMLQFGISANLMSLGGLAVGIGMMVDAAIVVVENVFRWLKEDPDADEPKVHLVSRAAKEVGRPVFFAISIVIVVFLPLFTLQGVEGTMFRPLAYTIALAMLGSLLFSLTLAPVLAQQLLKRRAVAEGAGRKPDGHEAHDEVRIVRWAQARYRPLLTWALDHRSPVILGTVALIAVGAGVFPFLGTEFIPTLNEGTLLVRATLAPSIALTESTATVGRLEEQFLTFPEVTQVVSRIGRGEVGAHADPVNNAEIFVDLKPDDQWVTADDREALVAAMQERLDDVPGVQLNFTQPIAAAVDELLTGIKAQIAVKLFGDDLDVLLEKANEIAGVLGDVEGASEIQVDQVSGQPQLRIDLDRGELSRYGIPVANVQELVRAAVGGAPAGQLFEGERRWTIYVRYTEAERARVSDVRALLIDAPDGTLVPLDQVATIESIIGPRQISREDNQRYITIQLNVRGRDIGSFVEEASAAISAQVDLPPGYLTTFGGQFELAQAANRRLAVVIPITILLIFGMLFASFNSIKEALLIILNIPLALVGGLVALLITGQALSVPASVGFIALFGIAVENGLVLITYFNQLHAQEGLSIREAVERGSMLRLRPVLMTAVTTTLGLIPLLLATGPGSEVQRPLAVAVVGGLVTSTALTLLVLPVLYGWLHREPTRF
ncbi:MAG: CusA/CzcA family heavy metal efflux RND transporter [Gemmatimonadetes bacterium]|nr:CusA/CzcA family heavy metal efflux RND transporter [Gemmatimonadota bacterium]MBT8404034.1 CusA/CzcA family heavy metal efflux RND transporter [Gemmatimonadota bacterium]